MERLNTIALAYPMLTLMLSACAIVDGPTVSSSGSGLQVGSAIAFVDPIVSDTELLKRARSQIEAELIRVGYKLSDDPQYLIEYGIAKRPSNVGILLPISGSVRAEEGSWRSRPRDSSALSLCKGSTFRLMIVVSRKRTGEIVYKGGSDDEICSSISDEKIQLLAASAIAALRIKSSTY